MRLSLIYSGGTIGCADEPLAPLPAAAFRTLWASHVAPQLPGMPAVDWQWLDPAIDSSEMTPADWARLARMVLDAHGEQAVLLLHGTDTMAWTAAALAFLLTEIGDDGTPVARFPLPVVLTGSQRPLFVADGISPGTDALANLRTALAAVATGRGEVMLAFGGVTFRGTRVMKMSTVDDRAFGYPNRSAPCPALPASTAERLSAQLDGLAPHLGSRAVVAITPTPGKPPMIEHLVRSIIQGMGDHLGAIYLCGFGAGNFPCRRELMPLFRGAHDAGVLIAAGTQVPHGPVDPSAYGVGHWLADCGALSVGDMTAAAAQAKLQLALALGAARGWPQERMEAFFRTPIAGEAVA